MSAVAKAANGDVIKLAAGTYSNVTLKGLNFQNGVTITSADPNKQAVLTDLMITGSKGIKIQNLELFNSKSVDLAFQVLGSSNIMLDNLNVHGVASLAATANARLMIIRSSSNVQVLNSEFSYGWHGISMLNNKQVQIENNYFHDLRTDGVRGGGNSDLTIRANMFTNFYPQAADHPDAIQLWTTNTSQASSNILIDQNVVTRGTGTQIQGIFMRDVSGVLPFNNVTITHNLIEGARNNGIALNGIKTGTVANNVVQGFPDHKSGIQTSNVTGLSVMNNLSSLFFNALKPIVGTNGNLVIPYATDNGAATAAQWLTQHSAFAAAWKLVDPKAFASVFTIKGGITNPNPNPNPKPTPGNDDDTPLVLTKAMALDASGGISALAAVSTAVAAVAQDTSITDTTQPGNANTPTAAADDGGVLPAAGPGPVPADEDIDDTIPVDQAAATVDDASQATPADEDSAADDEAIIIDTTVATDEADDATVNLIDTRAGGVVEAMIGVDHIQIAVTEKPIDNDIVVIDFEVGVDKIILTDARAGATAQNAQTFTFIDTASFTGKAGEVRYSDAQLGVMVQADIDGDGTVDAEFFLRDVHTLTVNDFLL